MRVLVVGAGPAGCTAGLALARQGVEAVVAEAEPALRPVGVGLLLQNSPLRALDSLGLVEACRQRGYVHRVIEMCDATGRVRTTIEPATLIDGPAMVAISRAALAEVLLAAMAAAGVELRLGEGVTALENRGDRVDATFGTRTESFDLVVGADGLHSRTRRMVLPESGEPRRTGQLIWRVSAPRPPEVTTYAMYDGGPRLGKVGVVPIGSGELYLWLLQTDTARPGRGDLLAVLRQQLAPFGGHVPAVAEVLRPDVDVRALHTLLVPPPWHRGRVVFLGDAVHTTSPHIAYGVGMAIEDSVVLTEMLAQTSDPSTTLAAFTDRRWERCRLVVESSVQLGEWEQHPPEDPSLSHQLTGRTLGVLSQPY